MNHVARFIEATYNFIYRMFFTRDDDLDILQLLFAILLVVAMKTAWFLSTSPNMSDAVRIQGVLELRWIIGMLVVTAVPKWLVPAVVSIVTHKRDIDEAPPPQPYSPYPQYPPYPPYPGGMAAGPDEPPIADIPGIPVIPPGGAT
jgi:hypothetical protein